MGKSWKNRKILPLKLSVYSKLLEQYLFCIASLRQTIYQGDNHGGKVRGKPGMQGKAGKRNPLLVRG